MFYTLILHTVVCCFFFLFFFYIICLSWWNLLIYLLIYPSWEWHGEWLCGVQCPDQGHFVTWQGCGINNLWVSWIFFFSLAIQLPTRVQKRVFDGMETLNLLYDFVCLVVFIVCLCVFVIDCWAVQDVQDTCDPEYDESVKENELIDNHMHKYKQL